MPVDEKGMQILTPEVDAVWVSPPGIKVTPFLMLLHYGYGIFPWHETLDRRQVWWSPDPRCVIRTPRINRSLRKTLKKSEFTVKADTRFSEVVDTCSTIRASTWISQDLIDGFNQLHAMGHAHSIEVYDEADQLVGGLFGISVGKMFYGESMFSRQENASKIAFVELSNRLIPDGYLIDGQVQNPYLKSLGAELIPRDEFRREVFQKTRETPRIGPWTDWFTSTDES
jgi:leucyl/phenylalanyl-tRNA--protein transferase